MPAPGPSLSALIGRPIRSRRALVTIAASSGIALLALQFIVKQPLKPEEIQVMRTMMEGGDRYLGTYAPDFTVTCLDGTEFHLADALGKNVVVINFFTTWCGPCRSEMKELTRFVNDMKNRPVRFIAVDVGEQKDRVAVFARTENLTFRIGLDPKEAIARKYAVRAFPTTVVIDPGGRIMQYQVGAIANVDVSLKPLVSSLADMFEHDRAAFDLGEYKRMAPQRLPGPDEGEGPAGADHDKGCSTKARAAGTPSGSRRTPEAAAPETEKNRDAHE